MTQPSDALTDLIDSGFLEDFLGVPKPPATTNGSRTVNGRQRRTNAELDVIDQAIITAIAEDAPVTLRGVYYRTVSAGAVAKTEDGYRLVQRQLLKLRRRGAVDYGDITDGTRWITQLSTWNSLDSFLDNAARTYRQALWQNQDADVLFLTEKDAISGVVLPIVRRWDVPLGVVRGYSSESFAWNFAQVVQATHKEEVWVYQLGDHDPSGVDAWRAFRESVIRFLDAWEADESVYGFDIASSDEPSYVVFNRLAVTETQIREWGLPVRPTKRSDSRARNFAGGSVEVDAIRAPVLRQLVEDAITSHINGEQLRIMLTAEQSEREILTRMRHGLEP